MLHLRHGPEPIHSVQEVFLTQILYSAGIALLGIFIPIYLLELGYGLDQVFAFLIISTIGTLMASPLAGYLNYKIGFHHTTLVRVPFFLGGYLTLLALTYINGHFFVPALLLGIAQALYYIPIMTLFARRTRREQRGSLIADLSASEKIVSALAPAAGGLIAVAAGFPVLILVSLTVVALSTVPLFLWREERARQPFRFRDILQMRHHSFVSAIIGDGFMHVAVMFLFPVLIYTMLGNLEAVGFLETAGNIAFVLIALFIGPRIDVANRNQWLRWGAVLLGLTLLARPFFTSWEGFAFIAVLGGFTGAVYRTSYFAAFYDAAEDMGDKSDEFVVAREIYVSLGKIALLGLVIMLPWLWGFYIAGAVLIGTALANRTVVFRH